MTALAVTKRKRSKRSLKSLRDFVDAQAAAKRSTIDIQVTQADLIANVAQDFVMGFDGFLIGLDTIVQTAITTGGTIQAQLNGVNVAGLVVTHANADAKGVRKTATLAIPLALVRGDRITLVPAGFATAGAVNVTIGMTAN